MPLDPMGDPYPDPTKMDYVVGGLWCIVGLAELVYAHIRGQLTWAW